VIPVTAHITRCGIPGIGVVPYGAHMCHFYAGRQDLIDSLVPYFVAGLRGNERCLWIAADPLPAGAIRSGIAQWPDVEDGLASGQLNIVDALEWYGEPSMLRDDEIIARWIGEEERALADGFQGLRIAGNTSFVTRETWGRLMEYESKLTERIQERRIVAFCSYSREACQPVEMMEAVRSHQMAFDRTGEHWQLFVQPPPPRAPRARPDKRFRPPE
jgi:hypothetical protein